MTANGKQKVKRVTTSEVRAWGVKRFGDDAVSTRGPLRSKVVDAYNRSHKVKYTPPA